MTTRSTTAAAAPAGTTSVRDCAPRLSVLSSTLVAFVVLWATIAAKPWAAAAKQPADPRLLALTRWQHRLSRESVPVTRLVDRRWAGYQKRLAVRRAQIRAAELAHTRQLAAARAAAARNAAAEAIRYWPPGMFCSNGAIIGVMIVQG